MTSLTSLFLLLPPSDFLSYLPKQNKTHTKKGSGDDLSSWKVTDLHVYVIKEPGTKQFDDPDGMQ
jgi:hypothetical protein